MATTSSVLDINSIVSQLMAVERRPLTKLAAKEAGYQAKLSAYGSVKGAVSSFQAALQALNSPSKFQSVTATASDSAVFSASATSTAVPGTYSLEVTTLAQPQKLVAAGQVSSSAAIGAGAATTVSFDFGTISGGSFADGVYSAAGFVSNGDGTKSITIDSSNNSLQGVRDAINAAKIGVTATIVNDGSGSPYRLALVADHNGIDQSLKISVSGDAAIDSLLAHNPAGTQNLIETATAQNANLKINGIAVTKTSNTISDVVEGVTLNLNKVTSSPETLTVARDTNSIKGSINSFVKAYNELSGTLKNVSAYDAAAKKGAILQGDSTVRSLQTQLRAMIGTPVEGAPGDLKTLSSLGINFQKDGTLAVDQGKLSTAMADHFDEIASLFAAVGSSSDSLVSFSSATSSTKPGSYALDVTQVATQGKTVGKALTVPVVIAADNNDTLNLSINGISASAVLSPGTYTTAGALAAELQAKLNGAAALSDAGVSVAVTESGGKLTITSVKYGSDSTVLVSGGTAELTLGLDGDIPSDGADVTGTIGGVTASGSGQVLTASGGDATGLAVVVNGGALGSRGTLHYSQGYAAMFDKWASSVLDGDGIVSSRTDGVDRSIKDIAKRRTEFEARMVNMEKRYRAQFVALDSMLNSMNSTSNFLTAQLANLPGSQNYR